MKIYNVLLAMFLSFYNLQAIPPDSLINNTSQNCNNVYGKVTKDMMHFLNTGVGIIFSPLSFDNNDWENTTLTTISTISLFAIDKNVRRLALKNQNTLNNKIFNFDSFYGNGYSVFFAGSLYSYGLFFDNNKIRRLGLNTFESFLYSGMITGILKLTFGRRRPFAGDSHLFFKPLQISDNIYQALPSGHTTVSFAVSTVMANYIDNTYWKIFWYGSAGMVAASRIYHNKHWISDVLLASAIGYFVGNFVVNRTAKSSDDTITKNIKPFFDTNTVGFVYSF